MSQPTIASWRERLPAAARAGALVFAGIHFALLIHAFVRRVPYPFDLEWMEGGVVEHVARLLEGRSLYVRPSVEFTSYLYNPLYYWLAAPLAAVGHVGYLPLRLLSVASTLACLALVGFLVAHETRSRAAAVAAAGCFAAAYPLGGAWYDIARADMLYVALLLGACYAARRLRPSRAVLVAAIFTLLAFLAKQTALAIIPALVVYFWVRDGARVAGRYTAASLVPIVLSVVLLDWAHEGWYRYYVFEVPAAHDRLDPMVVYDLFRSEVVNAMPVAFTVAAALLLADARSRVFYGLVGGALLVTGIASRAKAGSFINDWIVVHTWLAILMGVAVGRLVQRDARGVGFGLVALQLGLLLYSPRDFISTRLDVAEGRRVVDYLSASPGEVLIPCHPHYARLAGKRTYAQNMAVVDVLVARGDPRGAADRLRRDHAEAFAERRFDRVVLDGPPFFLLHQELDPHYRRTPAPFAQSPHVFWPKTGSRFRPEAAYVPR